MGNLYQILDTIADSYIPLLFIAICGLVVRQASIKHFNVVKNVIFFLLLCLFVSYSLMFYDNKYSWFKALSLDYSTHTAVAMSLVLTLIMLTKTLKWLTTSLIIYLLLMIYQQYHSLLDILTTLITILPFMAALYRNFKV